VKNPHAAKGGAMRRVFCSMLATATVSTLTCAAAACVRATQLRVYTHISTVEQVTYVDQVALREAMYRMRTIGRVVKVRTMAGEFAAMVDRQ
jgi:ABC-type proline/glycine betaine transport system substrate-binding protein